MAEMMLAAVVEKPGTLVVREVPLPTIAPTECLVQTLACALCNSTDHKLLHGQFRYKGADAYPGILGHEAVGRVVECGAQVTSFKVGDIVLRPMASYAPGAGLTCMYGGLAQFGKITETTLGGPPYQQIVPPDMDPIDATMLITLKETLSWLQRWPVRANESVVVLGSGPVGLSFAWFARMLGCYPVIVLGRRDEPLQRALNLGLDAVINTQRDNPRQVVREWTNGQGADRVIEAVGDDALIELGLSLLNPQGRLGIYGIAPTREPGDMERRAVDLGLARNEWALEFFGPKEAAPHQQMLWLVQQGLVHLKDWYTHVVPLEETQRGFDLLDRKEAFKVVVQIA
jgi:2-desacetyl-2-hydroxyethyl bacteriochlorophyllide A dehydrogenase